MATLGQYKPTCSTGQSGRAVVMLVCRAEAEICPEAHNTGVSAVALVISKYTADAECSPHAPLTFDNGVLAMCTFANKAVLPFLSCWMSSGLHVATLRMHA